MWKLMISISAVCVRMCVYLCVKDFLSVTCLNFPENKLFSLLLFLLLLVILLRFIFFSSLLFVLLPRLRQQRSYFIAGGPK